MFVDENDGALLIKNIDLRINRSLSKNDFLNSILYSLVTKEDVDFYSNYYIEKVLIEDVSFTMTLYFDDKNILFMIILKKIDDYSVDWTAWSIEQEKARDKEHKKFLKKYLGKSKRIYEWGEVTSSFDSKSASSSIIIRYI